jgi:predicted GH43/DUF377 family glycosyl hydrolase
MFYGGGNGSNHGSDTNFGDGIGYATSSDGITWNKDPNPVLYKTALPKATKRCYTPSVIQDYDGYWMYFTGKDSANVYTGIRAKLNFPR